MNWLRILLAPAFATLRERSPLPLMEHLQLRYCIENADFVGLNASLDQAIEIIPRPKYPSSQPLRQEFHSRFGWVNEQLLDGGLLQEVPQVSFDTHPQSGGRLQDHHLFGKSYILIWLCPFDFSTIKDHLQGIIESIFTSPMESRCFSDYRKSIGAGGGQRWLGFRLKEDLVSFVSHEFIDRLCLLEPTSPEELPKIKSQLKQDLPNMISESFRCTAYQFRNRF